MGYSFFQIERDAFLQQMLMNRCRHREVDRRHHLITHFDYRHMNTGMMQVLRHFQSDETGTYHHGAFHLLVRDISLDMVGIFYIAQREDAFGINAFQGGLHGVSTGRKQKFVIAFIVLLAFRIAYGNGLVFGMDGDYFILHTHINAEALAERFGCLYQQLLALCYHSTYIIR